METDGVSVHTDWGGHRPRCHPGSQRSLWDERSGQLVADQLARWKLTKGQAPPPAPGSSKLSRHIPGGQPEAHYCHPGHLGCGVGGVPGPQVGTAAAEAVQSPGPGAGA
ncbi:hypothetical protein HaLaN_33199, partial [Haematococcus lacustris]